MWYFICTSQFPDELIFWIFHANCGILKCFRRFLKLYLGTSTLGVLKTRKMSSKRDKHTWKNSKFSKDLIFYFRSAVFAPRGHKECFKVELCFLIFWNSCKFSWTLKHFLSLLGAHTALLISKNQILGQFRIFPCMFIFFWRHFLLFLEPSEVPK